MYSVVKVSLRQQADRRKGEREKERERERQGKTERKEAVLLCWKLEHILYRHPSGHHHSLGSTATSQAAKNKAAKRQLERQRCGK